MPIHRTIRATVAVASALTMTVLAQTSAGASTAISPKSVGKLLFPASYARSAGFTKVAEKVTTTSKTGQKSCPNAAEEAFESASGKTGVVSELVACTSATAAAALLKGAKTGTSATKASPPSQLGSSAIERSSEGSTYEIYWHNGAIVAAVAYTANVPASTSSSASKKAAPPITSAEQKILSAAALKQNSLLG